MKDQANATVNAAKKIIMLHGFPLSGKSTAAAKLKEHLARNGITAEVISSAKLRLKGKAHSSTVGFIDENNSRTRKVKDEAYRRLSSEAVNCLKRGVVPVLDATFHRHYRRQWVYRIGAPVYLVWTVFDSEEELKRHMFERLNEGKVVKLHTWEQYSTMVRQAEGIKEYELSGKRLAGKCPSVIIKHYRQSGKTALILGKKDWLAAQIMAAVKG